MDNPLQIYDERLDEALRHRDSFAVERIMQQYRSAGDKEVMVMALAARLLVEHAKALRA